jgi:glycosyltransferase involved in cell wall biosynthesis
MNLLFVIKALGNASGGAERVLAVLTDALAQRGHDVSVASFDKPGVPDFYALNPSVRRHRLGVGKADQPTGIGETWQRVRALRSLRDQLRPDVAIGFMHSSYVPLGLALQGRRTPVVASEHIDFAYWKTRRFELAAIRATLPLYAAMTVVGERIRLGYPAAIARRMTPISNPVAAAPSRLADTSGGARKLLLSVGRLAEQKDHRTLVAAFAQLAERHPQWDLSIVGEGRCRPELEAMVRELGLGERVSLPGATQDMRQVYGRAQLYAHPAIHESFGLVTAEALAYGLPAIGFADCSGTNEIIVDGLNGLLVEGGRRVESLAAGLDRMMGSAELRAKLGAAGPESVKRYSIAAITDAWERLLTTVCRH